MQIVMETFARGLGTMLSSQLGSVVSVAIESIGQRTYDEYVRDMPNPTVMTILDLPPLSGAGVLQLPLPVAYCAVELLLGGKGYEEQPDRALTELEMLLVRGVVERVLPELRYSLEPVVAVEPSVVGQEANPQFAQIAAPTDMMIIVEFQVKIESVTGIASLCIPFSAMQPHLDMLSTSSLFGGKSSGNAAEHRARMEEHLGETPVELAAEFRPLIMSSGDIVSLEVGDVIPLYHPVDEPLMLSVEGMPTLTVQIGRRNRRVAVQVVDQVEGTDARLRPARWSPLHKWSDHGVGAAF
jgi:flagellar motor switch protein FliM